MKSTYPGRFRHDSRFAILAEVISTVMHNTAIVIRDAKGVDGWSVFLKVTFFSLFEIRKLQMEVKIEEFSGSEHVEFYTQPFSGC